MTDFIKNQGGMLEWSLHAGQIQALESKARTVVVLAGTQSGKTSFGPLWFLLEIQRMGQGDYIVATPTFPLLELKLLPEFKRLFEKQLKLGSYVGNPTKKFTFSESGAKRMFGENFKPDIPTQVFFGHAQDPDSLESATAKGAWLDEAGQKKFKIGSKQAIDRRLSIHQGRTLITTTPYVLGWLRDICAKADGVNVDVINFRSVDNPAFPIAEYKKAKLELPKWKFNMFYRGLFERPAGMIYDLFDSKTDVIPAFEVPRAWKNRIIGIDFGGVNTAAVKVVWSLLDECWIVYGEYHAGGKTAKGHAASLTKDENPIPRAVGGAPSEDNWRLEMRTGGLPVRQPTVVSVDVGIDRVYGLFKTKKLKIMDNCTALIDEIQQYSRVLDDNDEPTQAIEDKSSYHLADALRYFATLAVAPETKPPDGTHGYQTLA
jgi:hypothetical protein